MGQLSQTFEHTCEQQTLVTVNCYNSAETKTGLKIYQEASKFFFEDLKSILEQTGFDIQFSEDSSYDSGTDCPYFELFGLQFPVMVGVGYQGGNHNYCVRPYITRTGSVDILKTATNIVLNTNSEGYLGFDFRSSFTTHYNDRLNIKYTINIIYGDNWIEISYLSRQGLKFQLLFLVLGKDINNKAVVYVSGNPNACNTDANDSGQQTGTFHYLIWCDNWYKSEYTGVAYPVRYYTSHPNYNTALFLKTINLDTLCRIGTEDNRVLLMQPICCGNRVFFDNMFVVPDTVNVDAFYTINNELYYCPGSEVVKADLQYEQGNVATYASRFLFKL